MESHEHNDTYLSQFGKLGEELNKFFCQVALDNAVANYDTDTHAFAEALIDIPNIVATRILEMGINLGWRRPEAAQRIVAKLHDARDNHAHELDEYCVPGTALDEMVRELLK